MHDQRAKSVITARYEDEVRRKIKAIESKRKLDKVLYRAKDELKKNIKTDFRATHNARCLEIEDKKRKKSRLAMIDGARERDRIK